MNARAIKVYVELFLLSSYWGINFGFNYKYIYYICLDQLNSPGRFPWFNFAPEASPEVPGTPSI